jgi:hypothetical protein
MEHAKANRSVWGELCFLTLKQPAHPGFSVHATITHWPRLPRISRMTSPAKPISAASVTSLPRRTTWSTATGLSSSTSVQEWIDAFSLGDSFNFHYEIATVPAIASIAAGPTLSALCAVPAVAPAGLTAKNARNSRRTVESPRARGALTSRRTVPTVLSSEVYSQDASQYVCSKIQVSAGETVETGLSGTWPGLGFSINEREDLSTIGDDLDGFDGEAIAIENDSRLMKF